MVGLRSSYNNSNLGRGDREKPVQRDVGPAIFSFASSERRAQPAPFLDRFRVLQHSYIDFFFYPAREFLPAVFPRTAGKMLPTPHVGAAAGIVANEFRLQVSAFFPIHANAHRLAAGTCGIFDGNVVPQ